MSPLVNQRLRISPPHTPRTRRQARPVHVARARTDTEHPQPQPGLSGARGARWGRRPASPAPSSGEQASRSSFFFPLAARLRGPRPCPALPYSPRWPRDWRREECGGGAGNRAAVPCRFSRDALEDFNACLIFGWWNRAGKAFPCTV